MSNNWITNELKTVNLKDRRLNHRFSKILNVLSERPNVSLPAACGGHTETMAAYRFFDHDIAHFKKIATLVSVRLQVSRFESESFGGRRWTS